MICEQCGADNADRMVVCAKCATPFPVMETSTFESCDENGVRAPVAQCVLCKTALSEENIVHVGQSTFCANCAPDEERPLATAELVEPEYIKYADPSKRILATLIDAAIIGMMVLILGGVWWLFTGIPPLSAALYRLNPVSFHTFWAVVFVLTAAYWIFFNADDGQTPGKMALHIAVVTPDGVPPSLGHSALRFFAAILSTVALFTGFIPMFLDEKHRAWHDRVANTLVASLDDVSAV